MRALVLLLLFSAQHITYRDEFHGDRFPASNYATCYDWGCQPWWNGELETYTPQGVLVVNGKLNLHATKTGSTYQSGMVTTSHHFSFLYGHIEARMLLPKGQGLWPALWLLAQDPNAPKYTELDMMEVLGNAPTQLHSGVHWMDSTGNHQHQGTTFSASDLSTGYHVYGVTWAADHITWYLDYKAYYTTTDVASIPHTAMYLLANLAVGGYWPGAPDSSTHFPADFLIDWLHVSQ
jgi:beta-glucanase (GH16 family)